MSFAGISLLLNTVFNASSVPFAETSNTSIPQIQGCPRIIERVSWNARPPAHEIFNLTPPVIFAIASYHNTTDCCTESDCLKRVRSLQTLHMETFGWDDIGPSFLIGGDGNIYKGRGWEKMQQQSLHWTTTFQTILNSSIQIGLIGNFERSEPSTKMLRSLFKLVDCGKDTGFLSQGSRAIIPSFPTYYFNITSQITPKVCGSKE